MSYILDALRRADAERQRSQTPALQQVALYPQAAPEPVRPVLRAARWLAPLLLAAAAGLAWWWFGRAPADPPAERAGAVRAPAAPLRPEPIADPAQPVAPQANRSAPLPVVRFPAPPAAPPSAAMAAAPAVVPSAAAGVTAAAAPTLAVGPAAPASGAAILASRLPEPLRGTVTRLPIGGAVHSQNRAQSFVLLAGQIVREGQTVAPGITLERIQPRALLLRVGAQLVELPM